MKKSHIIGLIVIAAAIGIIISTAGDASSYVTFDQAYQMASVGNKGSIHEVGELKKVLGPKVSAVLLATIDKDLTHCRPDQILSHFKDVPQLNDAKVA